MSTKSTFYVLLLLFLFLVGECRSRSLHYYSDSNDDISLVSDGMNDYVHEKNDQSPLLLIKQLKTTTNDSSKAAACEHMYGFLPCTNNLGGHLFQIVVYEYLLFLGERYITAGSELVFQILGPGVFGASVFEILGAFPESMILLVSGLSNSKETAQEKVFTGVGLLAGSTVFLLTILWGTCVVVGKYNFADDDSNSSDLDSSASKHGLYKKFQSYVTGYGVSTDIETSYTARIMVLSVVPLILVQVPEIFLKLSSRRRDVMLISLIVSIAFLLFYFLYQVFQPWIQKRRLEYVKLEHLMTTFLQHVEKHANGKLTTGDGTPNLPIIKKLFDKIDVDDNDSLSPSEFKELIMEIKSETRNFNKNVIIDEVIKEFDLDSDHMISKEEFVNGFTKWVVKTKNTINNEGSYSRKYLENLYQERVLEYARGKYLIQGILRHFESNGAEKLLTDEGTPNVSFITRLFEKFDLDGDNLLSHSELKEVIQDIKFGKIDLNVDDAVEDLIKELDIDGDHMINKEELIDGFTKFLDSKQLMINESNYEEPSKETDKLVHEVETSMSDHGTIKNPSTAGFKAGLLLILGIGILSLLAEPLIEVVQDFSNAANLPSFFVSFVILPLATNSRRAVSAISSARRKKSRTTSLTFSEIYGSVFMNNVLGLTALLSIVYARDLEWDFSAEVSLFILLLTLFLLAGQIQSRFITKISSSSSSSDLVSDGIDNGGKQDSFLRLNSLVSSTETCEQTYGFLPCTTTVFGNLFLIVAYGYLMFLAASFLSNGSELLLEILGPGIIGGLFLPVLGALPDAMLILVSGLSGSKETAQSQVLVGMGLLAGSTVMLLTVLWGSCVVVGKCDLVDSRAKDLQNTKGLSLTGSGVSTDIWTSYAARIMIISIIPFVIVQLPQILHTSSGKRLAVLIALIVAVSLLISYCLFQIFQPWIQERKMAYAKHKHVIAGILKHMHGLERLLTDDGEPNEDVIRKLFSTIDQNSDEYLSASELRALVIGIRFEEIDFDKDDAVQKLLRDFDTSGDSQVDEKEFIEGISKWLKEARRSVNSASNSAPHASNFVTDFHRQTKKEHDLLGNQSDEAEGSVENPKYTSFKAVLMLLLGTAIAAAFADPLVDAVDNFSTATSIPSFFISFIALPLATNSSEAVSALIFSSRKKQRTASLTFSEIYGAVTMNNILCLSVFLALVYARHLTWDFSAEVLVILIVCVVMGLFGSFRTTFPLWTCSIAFLLYPFSLALVYVLDYVFGWS
ncbi:EF-hand domain [Macleaya cordata]|uniref:EF-hand domain n=1 Tax=Macleaya cordata TaxID=56857 RepID=A0A200Q1C6_MACCD|nr:EF-hand domain [Macleaya cordata]